MSKSQIGLNGDTRYLPPLVNSVSCYYNFSEIEGYNIDQYINENSDAVSHTVAVPKPSTSAVSLESDILSVIMESLNRNVAHEDLIL